MEAKESMIAHEVGQIQKDPLRFGLQGVKSDIVGSHPLESLYQSVLFLSLNLCFAFLQTLHVPDFEGISTNTSLSL